MSKELTPLKAFKKLREQNDFLKQRNIPKEYRYDDELDIVESALKRLEKIETTTHSVLRDDISKKLKALNEILALYGKWAGHKIGDYEFFILLNDILDKYDLLKEV